MNLLTSAIRIDPEYGQLLTAVRRNFKDKPLPLLANGLCEGAAEAFMVSLIEDTCLYSKETKTAKKTTGRKKYHCKGRETIIEKRTIWMKNN